MVATTRKRRHQVHWRLQAPRRPGTDRGDPRPRRAAQGQADPARQRDRHGRRRLRDPLRARAPDAGRRPGVRLADPDRARGVLQRHEDAPQRPPGQPALAVGGGLGDLRPLLRAERARARGRVGRRDRARPAGGGAALDPRRTAPRAGSGAATSTSRRRTREVLDQLLPLLVPYDCTVFHMHQLRPGRRQRQGRDRAAGDRPAFAEEHGALPRRRRLRLQPVRRRRRPAADQPGLALRPLEGPARRDRRVPDREEGGRGPAACARRLARDRRPRGLGLLPA